MKKFTCVLLVTFLLLAPSLAKDKKVTFDAQAAWSYIKALASDFMLGRKSGQPGGVMGEEYIASKFKQWGLEPAGDNGTYFQNFTIEHRNIEEGVLFEVITDRERRDFYYGEDWRVQRYSGSGHFMAEIVFVGYGIHSPEKKYDDYAGVDIKGKVALISAGAPQRLVRKLGDETKMDKRVEAAQQLGARGIIVFQRPTTATQSRFFGIRVDKKLYRPDFVLLSVERKVTNFMFKDLDVELRHLVRDIDGKGEPRSMTTGVKVFVSVNAIFDEKRATRNVIAKITGTDRVLKDEYIVIGAHMDHLGITPMGDVMNGANDNASGTAVTMELARIMKLNKARPKRTVIFALWAAEEQGLLGSRHYADHSAYPIEKAIVNINMDMVGHGRRKIPFNGIYYGPQIWKVLKEKLPKEILKYVQPGRGGPGGSDHTPFLEKGIPAFFLITRPSVKYHQSRDDIDLIKPEMLKKTGDLVHVAVEILASEPGNFILPMRQETYYLKYRNLINFKFEPIVHVIGTHGDTKDSHVKLQVAIIKEKEGLSGDKLRVDIINTLFDVSEKIKKAKGLSLYSSSSRISSSARQGRTMVMPGLRGLNSFRDNPRWAEVLAAQGLYFVVIDEPSLLFGEEGLSEEGKKILKALNSSGILPLVKGASGFEAKALLEASRKPLVLIERDIPAKEVMELIKKKESALGLIWGSEEPAAYIKTLGEAKEAIGSEYLMMVNGPCLWKSEGKDQMLKIISEIIKAKFGRSDLSDIFSSTFMRALRKARGE